MSGLLRDSHADIDSSMDTDAASDAEYKPESARSGGNEDFPSSFDPTIAGFASTSEAARGAFLGDLAELQGRRRWEIEEDEAESWFLV